MSRCKTWFKKEPVLCIACLFACFSASFIPPSMEYFSYIDVRVLALLFSLMVVVAGFQECQVFEVLAQVLLQGRKNMSVFALVLVLLPFFSSMLITNDVALITFVPFAILVLHMINRKQDMILIIVLQTIAANLGSMATPFGNPQNLFLYSYYHMSISDFLSTMGLLTLCSLVLLVLTTCLVKNETLEVSFPQKARVKHRFDLGCYGCLFVCCLGSVLHWIPYQLTLGIVIAVVAWRNPVLLKRMDYGLLLTFVCFFIFSGNMGNINQIQQTLSSYMQASPLMTGIVTSQVMSNVPAAVLLSNFTKDGASLLLSTNLGGLGTLIASLASLISFKLYMKEEGAKAGRYLAVFTIANVAFLLVLLLVEALFL